MDYLSYGYNDFSECDFYFGGDRLVVLEGEVVIGCYLEGLDYR